MNLRNRNQKWSKQDVYILSRLMRERVPHATIAAVLGRSDASVRHAIKNTLNEQLLHHVPSDVLTYYQMEDEEPYNDVVDPVYCKEDTASDTTDASEESHISDAESSVEDDTDEEPKTHNADACTYIVTSILSLLVAGGAAMYVTLLKDNWHN